MYSQTFAGNKGCTFFLLIFSLINVDISTTGASMWILDF
jgi:hypothetical protein